MVHGGIPDSSRVIFPRPEGVRGLLIPHAHLIVDGVQQIVTPKQYAKLKADGLKARRHHLKCPCGAGVNFTSAHRHMGTFDIPDHFKTAVGEIHKFDCGYHTRKAARDLGIEDETEYDLSKPLRIHLNFKELWIRSASLDDDKPENKKKKKQYIFERNEHGLLTTPECKDWKPYSVTSLGDLVSIIRQIPIDRLLESIIILERQAIKVREFLLTSQSRNWTRFYNQIDSGYKNLRLFALDIKPQQGNLFDPPPTTLNSSQIKSDKNAPDSKRSFVLNPRLPADPDLIKVAAETGLVFVLSVPDNLKRGMKNNGCAIGELSIPFKGSDFVAPIPLELWQKMRPPMPEFKAA